MIFGLETTALPDGYVPLEAEAVIKCLDENGETSLVTRGTGLKVWDSVGMLSIALEWAMMTARNGLDEDEDPDHEDL